MNRFKLIIISMFVACSVDAGNFARWSKSMDRYQDSFRRVQSKIDRLDRQLCRDHDQLEQAEWSYWRSIEKRKQRRFVTFNRFDNAFYPQVIGIRAIRREIASLESQRRGLLYERAALESRIIKLRARLKKYN